ncbi:DUF3298 domain-containing protein [Metabacillus idriensis]|uniref:DUF3298 and DUF4163 domain-containing protein n=1 Tax=Metabacillus idriensis TaxID=324768 RepID=UPI003D2B6539
MTALPAGVLTHKIEGKKLSIFYPSIMVPQAFSQQKINADILKSVQDQIRFGGYDGGLQTEMQGTYEIKTNERDLLSLTLLNYVYSGGAHGMSFLKGLTYDTQTGKKYKLQDLFKKDSSYIERLSSIIAKQLKEREITLLDPPFKSIRPDQDFYLADKSLVIYFQLYEIAAYAYGFLYFPISIYDLEDLINPDGPLPKLYG